MEASGAGCSAAAPSGISLSQLLPMVTGPARRRLREERMVAGALRNQPSSALVSHRKIWHCVSVIGHALAKLRKFRICNRTDVLPRGSSVPRAPLEAMLNKCKAIPRLASRFGSFGLKPASPGGAAKC